MIYDKLPREDFFLLDEPRLEKKVQQTAICYFRRFIKPRFPNCRVIVNPFTEKRFSPKVIASAKAQGFETGQPDLLFIHKANLNSFDFFGLAIELKIYRKQKGPKGTHEKKQAEFLNDLRMQGLHACFAYGLKDTLHTIDYYFHESEISSPPNRRF